MSDFALFSLGETLTDVATNWSPSAPLTLFNKWIGVNNRYNKYIKLYCERNASNCDQTPEEIYKHLRIMLTRFALLHRSGHKSNTYYSTAF